MSEPNPEPSPHDAPASEASLPAELRAIDVRLAESLASLEDDVPPGRVDRLVDSTTPRLPARVLPFDPASSEATVTGGRRVRQPWIAWAALILVSVLSYVAVQRGTSPAERIETTLAVDDPGTFEIERPGASEAMLVAVLEPEEDWFEFDAGFGDAIDPEIGTVLMTRTFGVDDLSGDMIAMLGGPSS